MKDYYKILGCSKTSTSSEMRRLFRKKALTFHPDRNPGNSNAEKQFKEVNEAYQVLSNEEKRREYDEEVSALEELRRYDEVEHTPRTVTPPPYPIHRPVRYQPPKPQTPRQTIARVKTAVAHSGGLSTQSGPVCSTCLGTGKVSKARNFMIITEVCHCSATPHE